MRSYLRVGLYGASDCVRIFLRMLKIVYAWTYLRVKSNTMAEKRVGYYYRWTITSGCVISLRTVVVSRLHVAIPHVFFYAISSFPPKPSQSLFWNKTSKKIIALIKLPCQISDWNLTNHKFCKFRAINIYTVLTVLYTGTEGEEEKHLGRDRDKQGDSWRLLKLRH